MNRRSFVAALAAIALAPKAARNIQFLPSRKLLTGRIYSTPGTLQRAYRKMQLSLLDGFNTEPAEWDLIEPYGKSFADMLDG
jgi:hypothetical protein